jgi:hypothetical protein
MGVASGQWLVAQEAGGSQPGQTKSNQIKPNQTSCEERRWGGSGQWPVASGWWRKGVGADCPVKPSQTESNQSDQKRKVDPGLNIRKTNH